MKKVCRYNFETRVKKLGIFYYIRYKLWLIWFNLTY